MPFEVSNLVDLAVSKEFANLEIAFAELANLRLAGVMDKEREAFAKSVSSLPPAEDNDSE